MFPKLSQKAWDEMHKHYNITPLGKTSACDFEIIDAYNDLFDLEKYSITNDMLFDYIINQHRHFYIDLLLEVKSKSTPMNFSFGGTRKRDQSVCSWYRVVDNIRTLAFNHHSNEIIIIGEIHGWWEKGETE